MGDCRGNCRGPLIVWMFDMGVRTGDRVDVCRAVCRDDRTAIDRVGGCPKVRSYKFR